MIVNYITFDDYEFNTRDYANAEQSALEHEKEKLDYLSSMVQKEIEAHFDKEELIDCLGAVPKYVICDDENYLNLSAGTEFKPSEPSTIELGTWEDIQFETKGNPFSYYIFTILSDVLEGMDEEE